MAEPSSTLSQRRLRRSAPSGESPHSATATTCERAGAFSRKNELSRRHTDSPTRVVCQQRTVSTGCGSRKWSIKLSTKPSSAVSRGMSGSEGNGAGVVAWANLSAAGKSVSGHRGQNHCSRVSSRRHPGGEGQEFFSVNGFHPFRVLACVVLLAMAMHKEALHSAVHSGAPHDERFVFSNLHLLPNSCQARAEVAEKIQCPSGAEGDGCHEAVYRNHYENPPSNPEEGVGGGGIQVEGRVLSKGPVHVEANDRNTPQGNEAASHEAVRSAEKEGSDKGDTRELIATSAFCQPHLNRMSLGTLPILQTARSQTETQKEEKVRRRVALHEV